MRGRASCPEEWRDRRPAPALLLGAGGAELRLIVDRELRRAPHEADRALRRTAGGRQAGAIGAPRARTAAQRAALAGGDLREGTGSRGAGGGPVAAARRARGGEDGREDAEDAAAAAL